MVSNKTLVDAARLGIFLQGGSEYLGINKEKVNELNVFPVPDGDTGINMYLTVRAAAEKISSKSLASGVDKVSGDFALGALMGARGNSGVILSQMFRGFSLALAGKKECDVTDLAVAMKKGVDQAYKAVMKPVEGTILTVYRKLALAAQDAAANGANLNEMLEIAIKAGEEALANTPNQLPVLKEAGVVDAGGAGLLYFLRGGLLATKGEVFTVDEPKSAPTVQAPVVENSAAYLKEEISTADIEFVYCTQLLIKGADMPIDEIRAHLIVDPPGDSLLVVGDESLIKIHFHNNHPGKVLEYCAGFGSLHDIIIDNMVDQHHENKAAEDDKLAQPTDETTPVPASIPNQLLEPIVPSTTCGVIAICSGDGMSAIFSELGATVISGGQTMNPSAEDILLAIENNPGQEIVILPNNGNIILAADQAKTLTKKKVEVIKSKFVTQGITSMLAFDHDKDAKTNSKAMSRSLESVMNGELTYAIRASKFNGFNIKKGDILGLIDGKIIATGKKLDKMLFDLTEEMVSACGDSEIITLYWGQDVEKELAKQLSDELSKKFPEYEVEQYYGGQPLYYFLISVE